MSNVKQKREQVLEKVYDELLENGVTDLMPSTTIHGVLDDKKQRQAPIVQLIVALENANAAEEDLRLREDILDFDNAHKEIERKHNDRNELIKLGVTAGITIVSNVVWGMIFVHELQATRQFEIDGTETSAAGRWLKQSFPKFHML